MTLTQAQLASIGSATLAAKQSFIDQWEALKPEEQTDEAYETLAQQERDAIDVAHAAQATNPPGHPIRR